MKNNLYDFEYSNYSFSNSVLMSRIVSKASEMKIGDSNEGLITVPFTAGKKWEGIKAEAFSRNKTAYPHFKRFVDTTHCTSNRKAIIWIFKFVKIILYKVMYGSKIDFDIILIYLYI